VLGEADAARDAQRLQALGHAALAFTPMVCLETTDSSGAPAPWCCSRCSTACAASEAACAAAAIAACTAAAWPSLQHRQRAHRTGAALLSRWRDDLMHGAHVTDLAALRRLLDDAPVWLLGTGS
jgi:protein ImuB